MSMRFTRACLFAALAIGVGAGCPRYSTKMMYSVPAGEIRRFDVDPAASKQTVKVAVQATPAPVSVYVILAENEKECQPRIVQYQTPPKEFTLASAEKTREAVVEAVVPKDKGYTVYVVGSDKDTQVTVKISGG